MLFHLVLTTTLSIDIVTDTLEMKKKNGSKALKCLPKSWKSPRRLVWLKPPASSLIFSAIILETARERLDSFLVLLSHHQASKIR